MADNIRISTSKINPSLSRIIGGLPNSILNMYPSIMLIFKNTVESVTLLRALSADSKTPSCQNHKVAADASQLRNQGNEAYRLKQYPEALRFYTRSIAHAPTDSEELALAFGNRSAIHFVQEKYDLCLLDVNRALSGKLPESSKQTLLKRKRTCLEILPAFNKMKSTMKKKIRNDENRALYPTERKWLYTHNMSKNETDYKIDYGSIDDPVWSTSFENPTVPGLSAKVECAHNLEHGRHLVATANIDPGEVISIQEIFALLTNLDAKYQYCSYCTIWCDALIPCFTCTLEMYCSEGCRIKAYDSYHRTECKIITSSSFNPEKTIIWLALRIFLTGTKQGSDLKKLMHDPNVYDILNGKRECVAIPPSDYYGILSLTWNTDRKVPAPTLTGGDRLLEKPETFDNLMYSFDLLRDINFFNNVGQLSNNFHRITDIALFSGLLLLHHVVVAKRYYFNLFADFTTDPVDFIRVDERKIACTTVTLQGFMNHSCDANTMNAVNRRNVMIFSSRLIKKGEQIFSILSGQIYTHTPRVLRNMTLERNFNNTNCQCRACLEDWPEIEILTIKNKKNEYLTKDKILIQKIEKYHEWFNEMLSSNGPPYKYKSGDLEKVLRFNKDIRQYVREPSKTIAFCEGLIRKFLETRGNSYVVRKLPSVPKLAPTDVDG